MKLSAVAACRDLRVANRSVPRYAFDVDCENQAEYVVVGRLLRQMEKLGKIMAVSDLDGLAYGVIFSDYAEAGAWREGLAFYLMEAAR